MDRPKSALLPAILTMLLATSSLAAEPAVAPVKAIMDATVANWSGGNGDWQDMFDEAHLGRLFSADFVRDYKAAQNYPASEDGISPFSYDVIVGGADACPLENLTIAPQAAVAGKTEIVVRFQKSRCMGADADFQAFSEVRFEC